MRTEFPPNIIPQDRVNNRSILASAIRARTSGVNPGSDIVLQAKNLTITDGGQIINGALGEGAGGVLTIGVADTVRLSGAVEFLNPRLLNRSTISNATSGLGNAGELRITARNVELLGGAEISSKTLGKGIGNAGNVTIHATENVTLSGISTLKNPTVQNPNNVLEISSQISSNAVELRGRNEESPLGSGGDIIVTAKTVTLKDGASVQTTSLGREATDAVNETVANTPEGLRPHAGNITINADILTVSGARTTGGNAGFSLLPSQIASGATGPAGTGNIMVAAGEITIRDAAVITSEAESHTPDVQRGIIALTARENLKIYGGKISAQSSGSGNAGDIHLTAANTILLDGATVTTEAAQASGGNIKLTAQDLIRLSNSTISSSVEGDATTAGGNINVDPDFIVLQNSKILAKAVQGQGGNISLIANNAVLVDPLSVLDASSALGVSGLVDIQAPIQNLSGTLAPLPEETVPVTALYGARCAAGAGGNFSTFVDSKAGSLSPTPGAFLASPLLNLSALAHTVADRSPGQQGSTIFTASIAPLVLGHAGESTTACP
ncbi:MAG: hypothetical protein WD032_06180 [Nitrospirales bacterium]